MNTGVIRHIDDLGRLVLPIGFRKVLGIDPETALEILCQHDHMIVRAYRPGCSLCGDLNIHKRQGNLGFCKGCFEKLTNS
jgi:transcriptional pleiotropic regulator of transition state genes